MATGGVESGSMKVLPLENVVPKRPERYKFISNFLEIIGKGWIEFRDPLLHFFCPNVDCPGTPILFLRIHAENLHFPKSMDGVIYWVVQALPDIADTAHPLSLVSTKRLPIKLLRGNGAGADDGQVGEWKSWQVSDFRELEDAVEENRYQFYLSLQAFLVNPLDTLQAATGRNHIDLLWPMVDKTVS